MATLGIGADKAPAGVVGAWRSDGDTIPVIAAGTEVVGDVIERTAGIQAIGLVQSLDATDMTGGTGGNDAVASAGSEIQVRVAGMFYLPVVDGTYADGALVAWNGTAMAANATGAHEIVGGYVSGDTHACVRININPGAAT